jgi:AcrR family transcriptional regulator
LHSRARKSSKAFTPRKRPLQERAQATVDAILQATTYILVRNGWRGLATNSIAERAGVNIASLYQYFPNKEAIVAELRRRYLAQLQSCESSGEKPKTLRAALRSSVETLIRQRQVNPELHRVFEEELPRSTGVLGDDGAKAKANFDVKLLRKVPDLELAGFISRAAATSIIDTAARERPELLASADFKDEVVTLLERYLRR